jgi:flagellar biosynthesis GTPase FlhF
VPSRQEYAIRYANDSTNTAGLWQPTTIETNAIEAGWRLRTEKADLLVEAVCPSHSGAIVPDLPIPSWIGQCSNQELLTRTTVDVLQSGRTEEQEKAKSKKQTDKQTKTNQNSQEEKRRLAKKEREEEDDRHNNKNHKKTKKKKKRVKNNELTWHPAIVCSHSPALNTHSSVYGSRIYSARDH